MVRQDAIQLGNFVLYGIQSNYLTYLELYPQDFMTRIVKFPLGPVEVKKLDNCLFDAEYWGRPFSIETPVLNAKMDKYTISVGNACDYPSEFEDRMIIEIHAYDAMNNRYVPIVNIPVDTYDIINLRSLLYKITTGGEP